jgi:predicted nucleotidyltransferase
MANRPLIETLQDTLARHPGLELAIVFGSVALGAERADSDVDLAVQGMHALDACQKLALVGDLSEATGRAVDLIDLRTVGEPLLGQILTHGRRLLGSDEAYGRLLSRHLIDAADFLPCAQRIVDERRRAWIGK